MSCVHSVFWHTRVNSLHLLGACHCVPHKKRIKTSSSRAPTSSYCRSPAAVAGQQQESIASAQGAAGGWCATSVLSLVAQSACVGQSMKKTYRRDTDAGQLPLSNV